MFGDNFVDFNWLDDSFCWRDDILIVSYVKKINV